MKVAIFIDTYYPMIDGVIKVVDNYARRLAKKCDVTVFCPKVAGYDDGELPYRVRRCFSMPIPHVEYDFPMPFIDPAFMTSVLKRKFDIIHIHSPFTIGMTGVNYAHFKDVPVVATLHSQYRQDAEAKLKMKALQKVFMFNVMHCFNNCDVCWAVNEGIKDLYVKEYGLTTSCFVQPNATDHVPISDPQLAHAIVESTYNIAPNDVLFSFVGRLEKVKNIFFIVRSLKILKDKGLKFKMIYVGEGSDEGKLKKLIGESGLKKDIILAGKLVDKTMLQSIYSRSKLFLFPSLYDASSLVQIEAACQGTPTLFIEGARTATSVVDNVNGFIAEGTEVKFAEKIEQILADEELYIKVSEGAKRDLYRTWDGVVDKVYEDYKMIIANYKSKKKSRK